MRKIVVCCTLALLFIIAACSSEAPKANVNAKPTPAEKTPVAKAEPTGTATTVADPVEEPTAESKEASEEPKEDQQVVPPIPEEELEKAREILASVDEDAVAAVEAKKKYKMFCAACHGFTGNLNVNGAKDLTKSVLSMEESVAQVYHGRGLMTPFKGLLSDTEIVAVARYIEKNLRK